MFVQCKVVKYIIFLIKIQENMADFVAIPHGNLPDFSEKIINGTMEKS